MSDQRPARAIPSTPRSKSANPRWAVVAELAARQHGVVATRQLRAGGIGSATIARWAADRRLIRLHHGVYAVGHTALILDARRLAAVLAAGPSAALSHRSAAHAWGLRECRRSVFEVSVPSTSGSRSRRGIQVHRTALDARDLTVRGAVPITTPARTLLDLAGVVPAAQLARALDAAEKARLLDLRALQDAIARARRGPGRARLAAALELYAPEPAETRSWLEDVALPLIAAAGLPRPQVNVWLHGQEVDLLWPRERLVVELDSRRHHHTTWSFEEDRARDARLVGAGLRVIRLTHRRVTRDPAGATATLAAALSAAGAGR